VTVRTFCFRDAEGCAVAGQNVPDGHSHLDRMLTSAAVTAIGLCAIRMDARAVTDTTMVAGALGSSLEEVADWALWADRTITFDRPAGSSWRHACFATGARPDGAGSPLDGGPGSLPSGVAVLEAPSGEPASLELSHRVIGVDAVRPAAVGDDLGFLGERAQMPA
jgi:hypothetical protein